MIRTLTLFQQGLKREVVEVKLSDYEYRLAEYAGILRNEESKILKLKSRAGIDEEKDGLKMEIVGTIGEYVASIATGRAWTAFTAFKAPDLAGGIEVRTNSRPGGSLKIYRTDPDNSIFIHVTPTNDRLTWIVQGWILGKDGKVPMFWGDPTMSGRAKAYFVDTPFLRSITELKV